MELIIELDSEGRRTELFGAADVHLKSLRDAFGVKVIARDTNVTLIGEDSAVEKARRAVELMQARLARRHRLTAEDVDEIVFQQKRDLPKASGDAIRVFAPKGQIEPCTDGQVRYIRTMRKNDLTFCSGPAGTGKTYLAVAVAVSMLKQKLIRKIVLARPAVEAGERLGFLPGDIQAKVNPYLRPLFDSLEDMMEFSQMRRFMDMDIIEVIPLAFMRGRTLNEACIICDEAQNTTPSQMLMFLTRMGRNSKMIITGDMTQVDLARGDVSGMLDAYTTLKGVEGIGFATLDRCDIVRHKLVQNIVQAYESKGSDLHTKGV